MIIRKSIFQIFLISHKNFLKGTSGYLKGTSGYLVGPTLIAGCASPVSIHRAVGAGRGYTMIANTSERQALAAVQDIVNYVVTFITGLAG